MNNLDKSYQSLLQDILDNGYTKSDRTGTGTISVFGRQIRHNMKDGFPLLTTKKMAWKTMVTELLWFLRGDTNIKYLVDNNCHIWDGDAYKNYFHKTPSIATGLTQEEFINKIKTDDEFAKNCGLKIEEKALNAQERLEWVKTNVSNVEVGGFVNNDEYMHKWIETLSDNIPTKLITITYNDKTIESYE